MFLTREEEEMSNVTAALARQNFLKLLNSCVTFGQQVTISTPKGTAVLINGDEYNGLMETAYLCNIPGMRKSLLKAKATPLKNTKELKIHEL